MSTITRRGFVGGTAGVIGTVAAGTLLAQSQALANEDTDTLEPVVSKEDDWLGEPPEIDEEELTETVEVEIVIVGAGNGGCMCACRAAENGADVVVLEKQAASFNSRNFIGGVGTRWQESSGHAIDRNDIVCELVRYSSGWANQKLINRWADNSADMLDYYDAILEEAGEGIMLEYGTPEGTRYTGWPTNHFPMQNRDQADGQLSSDYMSLLIAKAQEYGADFRYETEMLKVERDEERVTGVIAQNAEGNYIRFNASKGVVLCTGGYAGNEEMIDALQPWLKKIVGSKLATDFNNGSGIKAGLWVGAMRQAHPTAMLFDRAVLPVDFSNGDDYSNGRWSGYSQPALRVNSQGNRFSNESMPYDFNSHASHTGSDGTWFQIFDSNYCEDFKAYDTMGCSRLVPGPGTGFSADGNTTDDLEGTVAQVDSFVEGGFIQTADTLEELAEKLGLPADNLVATVERYNELCDNGSDDDFGKEASRMRPCREAPFYGGHVSSWLLCTLDGLCINDSFQVIDLEGNPIEGLYAIGNDAGDYFCGNYPELIVGAAVGRTNTFGYLLGKELAEK